MEIGALIRKLIRVDISNHLKGKVMGNRVDKDGLYMSESSGQSTILCDTKRRPEDTK